MTFTRYMPDKVVSAPEITGEEVLRAVTAHGLSSAWQLGDRPLPDAVWENVLPEARRGRLLGLLGEAVSSGALTVSDSQREQLKSQHLDAQARSVLLERMALRLIGLLSRQGVATVIMGGLAASHCDYTDPSLRPVDRIGLLIDSSDLPMAQQLLEAEGWRRALPEPARGFDQKFGMGVRMRDDASVPLDLLRTLAPPPYSLAIPVEALWDHVDCIMIGGVKASVAGGAVRLLHACAYLAAAEGETRMIRARDLAQSIYAVEDAGAVVELARSWQLGAVLAWGVHQVWAELRLEESLWLTAWAECYEPTRWERRALARVVDPRTGYAAKALTALPLIPGIGQKTAFARATLFPDRSYRRGRRRRRLHRLVHLVARRGRRSRPTPPERVP
jgi:hypothetical protein